MSISVLYPPVHRFVPNLRHCTLLAIERVLLKYRFDYNAELIGRLALGIDMPR